MSRPSNRVFVLLRDVIAQIIPWGDGRVLEMRHFHSSGPTNYNKGTKRVVWRTSWLCMDSLVRMLALRTLQSNYMYPSHLRPADYHQGLLFCSRLSVSMYWRSHLERDKMRRRLLEVQGLRYTSAASEANNDTRNDCICRVYTSNLLDTSSYIGTSSGTPSTTGQHSPMQVPILYPNLSGYSRPLRCSRSPSSTQPLWRAWRVLDRARSQLQPRDHLGQSVIQEGR